MIRAADKCPCMRCNEDPLPGGVLCRWHEAYLNGQAHRRYIGSVSRVGQGQRAAVYAAFILAVQCAAIARREGFITHEQLSRVMRRYPDPEPTSIRRRAK